MVQEFKKRILPARSALVVAHDYPDPDCLASAFGVSRLLRWWGVENTIISFGGFVGRAENRAMIRFLSIETLPMPLVHLRDFERVVLVDSYPGKGNVSLPDNHPVDAVFDHHLDAPTGSVPFFFDIRKDIGATSTIVAQYLFAAGFPMSANLATALFYGIKTDTGDIGRDATSDDLACYKKLFEHMDHRVLSHIENPDRDPDFYRIVHDTAEALVTVGPVGFAHIPRIGSPDYVGEMADFFQSLDRLEWIVITGTFKKNVYFSMRTKRHNDAGRKAESIARALDGAGGGHGKIGAGKIPLGGRKEAVLVEELVKTIREVFRSTDMKEEHVFQFVPARGSSRT